MKSSGKMPYLYRKREYKRQRDVRLKAVDKKRDECRIQIGNGTIGREG